MTPALLCLGRNGDVINALAIARILHQRYSAQVPFLVGAEFAPALEGCSYVAPVVYPLGPERLRYMLEHARRNHERLMIPQVFMNPDQSRQCDSFGREAWRLAGVSEQFGTALPLFDQRDPEREQALVQSVIGSAKDVPYILFAGGGISSPFHQSAELLAALRKSFPNHLVVDMSSVVAERIFDLGALFEGASLLVSVDTMHLWLARAFPVPTIALINDGWFGSPSPPCAVATFRYGKLKSLEVIIQSCRYALRPAGKTIMVVDVFGSSERHQRAAASRHCADVLIERSSWPGADQPPALNDLLRFGALHGTGKDVVIWTNDDVQLLPCAMDVLKEHCARYGAVTVRREAGHIGRELFAATIDWLRDHLLWMPRMTLALPWFDLALACYVRKSKGIRSTMDNLMEDMAPCEISGRNVLHHEAHESGWLDKRECALAQKNRAEFEHFLDQPV